MDLDAAEKIKQQQMREIEALKLKLTTIVIKKGVQALMPSDIKLCRDYKIITHDECNKEIMRRRMIIKQNQAKDTKLKSYLNERAQIKQTQE